MLKWRSDVPFDLKLVSLLSGFDRINQRYPWRQQQQ